MKWRYETREERLNRRSKWRPWFAWYPVSAGGQRAWLEWVEYREELFLKATPFSGEIWLTYYRFKDSQGESK